MYLLFCCDVEQVDDSICWIIFFSVNNISIIYKKTQDFKLTVYEGILNFDDVS